MIVCPHCRFKFAGPDIPREAPPDLLCPVCGHNLSEPPSPPITGSQVFAKYLAAIVAGFPVGWLVADLVGSVFDRDSIPGVVPIGLSLLAMFAIGDFLGRRMKKMRSVPGRWLLLLGVAVLPVSVLGVIVLAAP